MGRTAPVTLIKFFDLVEAVRYCPMCNQPRPVERSRAEMFVIYACAECGHVHRVSESYEVPPSSSTGHLTISAPPPLNHDGEPLHTGDDARIDCVTGIRAAIEEAIDDLESDKTGDRIDGNSEAVDTLRAALEECAMLDRLLIETIARERVQ
jgi:hypothetical protein